LSTHEARLFALISIATVPDQQRELYSRYIRAVVPPSVRKELNKLMSTVIKDPFMDGLIAKGEAVGAAHILLRYLDSRFAVPDDRRRQVEHCRDAGRIEGWFDQALTATTLDQVFAA
jgi:hypothetical protein